VGVGYKVAIETLNTGRIGIGAQMIGVARGALTAALRYAKERKQFGKPIGEFQAVQFQLAQAATELEAARLMVYNAARLETAGRQLPRRRRWRSCSPPRSPSGSRRSRWSCLAVTATPRNTRWRSFTAMQDRDDLRGDEHMQLNTIAKQLLR